MILTLGTTPALQRTMTFASLTVDDVNRAVAVREYASGKGINVARVVHTLGKPCVATGFLGGDSASFCRRDMDAARIGHDFVSVASKTRMCITLVDQTRRTATELIEEAGPVTQSDAAKLLVKLELLLQPARVLVLSGTLAPGLGDDFYARCIRLANAAHVPAILDAKGAPLKLALQEKPFLVKPNRSELSATVERPIQSEQQLQGALRNISSMGAHWTVVTNGPRETIVSDGKATWRLATPKIDIVSPIGSGDSFAAGLAIGLMNAQDVPAACRLGAACGAANAMTDLAGHVRPDDVECLQQQVCVERIV